MFPVGLEDEPIILLMCVNCVNSHMTLVSALALELAFVHLPSFDTAASVKQSMF
jgi:hypothetical protein